MALNEQAMKNHEAIYPDHISTLAITDSKLMDIFDNFTFDEMLRHSNLDIRTRLITQLAAPIAARALGEYRMMAAEP